MVNVQSTSSKIKSFLASKEKDKLSKNTIRSYEQKLNTFVSFCGEDFDEIDRGILRNFFDYYGETHEESTVNAVFTVVKIFYNWIEVEVSDMIDDYKNPMLRLKAPRVPPKTLDPISLEDFSKMFQYCNTCKNGTFYSSMLYFLLDTGARAEEFLSLDINDVDLLSNEVLIKHGKGNKERTVFIGRDTKKLLKAYLKKRTDNDPALWFSSYGRRLTYSGLNRILKTIANKAGIEPPSPHAFRRAFCKNMILDNTNPYVVQVLMGWTSNAVLQKYVKLYSTDIGLAHGQSGVDKWLKGYRRA